MLKPRFLPCLTLALASFLIPIRASAADNWIEVRSPHFTVNTNAGEKEARKIADQFEQIRQMFHSAFPAMRVDPGQPIIIVAAKSENTMKLFLPEEWEVKGHIHHAGMYQPGEDKDYVVMRLDSEGENPFHTLYHEYTHALMRLNFSGLPLWLDEGMAEFLEIRRWERRRARPAQLIRGTCTCSSKASSSRLKLCWKSTTNRLTTTRTTVPLFLC